MGSKLIEVLGLAELLDRIQSDIPLPVIKVASRRIAGEVHAANGQLQLATAELQAAAELDRTGREREYLARVLALRGRLRQSLELYEAILESVGRTLMYDDVPLLTPGLISHTRAEVDRLRRIRQ